MFDKTEDEQIALLKEWFQKNFTYLLIFFALAGGGTFGWLYWQDFQDSEQTQASALYTDVYNQAVAINQDSSNDQLVEALTASFNNLATIFPDNIYTSMAQQIYARVLVDADRLSEAIDLLLPLIDSSDDFIKNHSRLTLAKIRWQQGQDDAALAIIANMGEGFIAAAKELEGDIYLRQNNTEKAREAYAIANESSQNNMLLLKLNSVPALP